MIVSGFIAQLRRKYDDQPKAAQVIRGGDGATTLFNVGRSRLPIIENSYSVYKGTSAQTEVTDFTLNKDTGDLEFVAAPASNVSVKVNFKHANFRDQHWVDAINNGIDKLNGRGFVRQIVRDTSSLVLSADTQVYNAPSGCVEIYQFLVNDGAGNLGRVRDGNFSYQSDANKLVLGWKPDAATSTAISYKRRLNKYQAVSATLDVLTDWEEPLEKAAGAYYFANRASKIAQQGNATVEEGHFSFSNLRAQGRDLLNEFELDAKRMKPVQAAKDIRFHIPGGGAA